MLTALPGGLGELREAYQQFRQAPDKAAAKEALTRLGAAATGLHQSVRIAFQEELAPPAAEALTEAATVAETAPAPVAETTPAPVAAEPAGESTAKQIKKGVGGLIKKKVRIP
jgi:hypothetical protein